MTHGKGKALGCLVLVAAVFVCSTRALHSTGDAPSQSELLPTTFGKAVDRDVAAVRAATESFKVLDNAVAAGYDAHVMQCVQNPPEGGMGFHHAKAALRDSNLEVEKPEILTYARTPEGRYKLTGVEYVVPITAWPRNEPPSIMGQNLKRAESLGIWYSACVDLGAEPVRAFCGLEPSGQVLTAIAVEGAAALQGWPLRL